MPHTTTKRDTGARPEPPVEEPLTTSQELAIDALVAGESVTEAARQANVDRTTVHRWLSRDDAFAAVFNGRRRELRDTRQRRLEQLADKALSALERSLEAGDGRVAVRVLAGLGMLSGAPPAIGPDDPATVAGERKNRESLAALQASLREAMAENARDL